MTSRGPGPAQGASAHASRASTSRSTARTARSSAWAGPPGRGVVSGGPGPGSTAAFSTA